MQCRIGNALKSLTNTAALHNSMQSNSPMCYQYSALYKYAINTVRFTNMLLTQRTLQIHFQCDAMLSIRRISQIRFHYGPLCRCAFKRLKQSAEQTASAVIIIAAAEQKIKHRKQYNNSKSPEGITAAVVLTSAAAVMTALVMRFTARFAAISRFTAVVSVISHSITSPYVSLQDYHMQITLLWLQAGSSFPKFF